MAHLEEYRRKRHAGQTPEPEVGKPEDRAGQVQQVPKLVAEPGTGNRFVVQKHDATRLHYDFRLEIGGVLASWAVPKGPSLNPLDKRLAMHVEDHPLDYAGFEGVIPKGEYGAGPVMVWDAGTFDVEGGLTAQHQLDRGELKFALHGHKLRGSFALVKIRNPKEKGDPWLMIKHRDAAVDPNWDIDEHDGSVLTGRTIEEIEEGLPPSENPAVATAGGANPAALEGARKATMPSKIAPMLATLAEKPFSHPDWVFEIKWDGIRALAWIDDGRLELHSRTGRTITTQYPELATLPERVKARQAILDGEIVVLDANGRSDFERLQSRMNVDRPTALMQRQAPIIYYLFDVLYADGYDLREVPLVDRKQFLRALVNWGDPVRYADHQAEMGKELFDLAKSKGLEGIIGKHAQSAYASARTSAWLKFKIVSELDAVIGGWTEPRGSREHFGALLLGLYEGEKLRFIGGVGTGFTEKTQQEVFDQIEPLATTSCPFDAVPDTKEKATWMEPRLVARVKYGNWTEERRLRAPVYLGLRKDYEAKDCRFENEVAKKAVGNGTSGVAAPPKVAFVPRLSGRVLAQTEEIQEELFHGHAENVIVEIDGRQLRFSNLNKVYFPGEDYTKRDLLAYYYRIAPYLLPFLKDRPLVLRRYPNGITGEAFFQKDAGEIVPDWMETVAIRSEDHHQKPRSGKSKEIRYFIANSRAAVLYLTNLGCIDHNPWSSRRDDLEHPDWVFFDLDPSDGTDYSVVVTIASAIYEKLTALGLTPYLKTSGATGFHLYIPVEPGYTYEHVRTFAEIVGRLVAAQHSELVTQERMVEKRPPGRVLIDASQNAYGRPLAAPYVVRAFPKAPVSAPVEPKELRPGLTPEKLNIRSVFDRLEIHGDLWADFWKNRQRLEEAVGRLAEAHH
jgi:bifunctional non-homologous end joining protein LigD